jgi:superfamily II DNA helicase RecQ
MATADTRCPTGKHALHKRSSRTSSSSAVVVEEGWACRKCCKPYNSKSAARKHVISEHSKLFEELSCNTIVKRGDGSDMLKCKFCELRFDNDKAGRATLTHHLGTKHLEERDKANQNTYYACGPVQKMSRSGEWQRVLPVLANGKILTTARATGVVSCESDILPVPVRIMDGQRSDIEIRLTYMMMAKSYGGITAPQGLEDFGKGVSDDVRSHSAWARTADAIASDADMAGAFKACVLDRVDNNVSKRLRAGLQQYMRQARIEIGDAVIPLQVLSRIKSDAGSKEGDDRLGFKCVQNSETEARYAGFALPLLIYVWNANARRLLSGELGRAGGVLHVEALTESGALDAAIHGVLQQILLTTLSSSSPAKNHAVWPVVIAMCIESVDEEGGIEFRAPRSVTSPLAALKYVAKCAALREVFRIVTSETMSGTDKDASVEAAIAAVVDGEKAANSPVMLIKSVSSKATNSGGMQPEAQVSWCEEHGGHRCLWVNNKELGMDKFGEVMRRSKDAMRGLLQKLTFFRKVGGKGMIRRMKDDLRSHEVGRCWLTDTSNKDALGESSIELLRIVEGDKKLSRELLDFPSCAPCPENTAAYERYMAYGREVVGLIGLWLHSCCGGVARGPELNSLLIRTTSKQMRSFFVSGHGSTATIVAIQAYNKSTHKTETERLVARFLPKDMGALVFDYLTYVRPFECVLVLKFYGAARARLHRDKLFSKDGLEMKDDLVVQQVLKFAQQHEITLKFSELRHWHKAIQAEHVVDRRNPLSVTLHSDMFGHTAAVGGNLYGQSMQTPRVISADIYEASREHGLAMRRALGLESGTMPPAFQMAPASVSRTVAATAGLCDGGIENLGVELADIVSKRVAKDVQQLRQDFESLRKRVMTTESGDTVGEADSKRRRVTVELATSARHIALGRETSLERHADVVTGLRAMFRDQEAMPRSRLQTEGVVHVLERRSDVLYVAGTGSGKSVVFYLPTFLESPDTKTAVVVPTSALVGNVLREAARYGLATAIIGEGDRCSAGDDESVREARIIVFTLEGLQSERGKVVVRALARSGKLSRFVLDEVHTVVQWANFRPALSAMSALLRPEGITVPILGLSATVPPNTVHALEARLGTSFLVLRASTSRPEIEYIMQYARNRKEALAKMYGMVRQGISRGKGIVFCMTLADCRSVCEMLHRNSISHMTYNGTMARSKKCASDAAFRESKINVLVATTGYSVGVDTPGVLWTVSFGGDRDTAGFAQASGRAARGSGDKATATVVLCETILADALGHWYYNAGGEGLGTDPHKANRDAAKEFVAICKNDRECFRKQMHDLLDGPNLSEPCILVPNAQLCSSCTRALSSKSKQTGALALLEAPAAASTVVRRPLSSVGTPVRKSAAAAAEAEKEWRKMVTDCLEECRRLHGAGTCVWCYVVQRGAIHKHGVLVCPTLPLRSCVRCLSTECSNHSCQENLRSSPVCYSCFTFSVAGQKTHSSSEYGPAHKCPLVIAVNFAMAIFVTEREWVSSKFPSIPRGISNRGMLAELRKTGLAGFPLHVSIMWARLNELRGTDDSDVRRCITFDT